MRMTEITCASGSSARNLLATHAKPSEASPLSPESFDKNGVCSYYSDLYAVAAVAFELFTGYRHWQCPINGFQTIDIDFHFRKDYDHKEKDKFLYMTVWDLPGVSTAMKTWLAKGLKQNHSDRFQTAKQMMEHTWFEGFDFDQLRRREMPAPFVPKKNVQYFSKHLQKKEEKAIRNKKKKSPTKKVFPKRESLPLPSPADSPSQHLNEVCSNIL